MSDQKGDALLRRLGREARRRHEVETDPAAAVADQPGDSDRWPSQSKDSGLDDWTREAQRPLDDEAKSRIVDRLSTLLAEESENEQNQPATSNPTERPSHQKPVRPPKARGRPPAWIAVPIAATLLVALGIAFLRPGGPAGPLPEYRLAIEGVVQSERGPDSDSSPVSGLEAPATTYRLALGNRLQLVMAPAEPTEDLAIARAFLDRGDGWQELPSTLLEQSQQGAVRLDAIVGEELDLVPGPQRLLVVVSASGDLPAPETAAEIASLGTTDPRATWRARVVSLEILDPAVDTVP